jgi:tetratricopeptide (TPR) repeat protein
MKRIVPLLLPALAALLLLCAPPATGQHHSAPPAGTGKISLLPGLGEHHYGVSTANAEAQAFFNQGLTLVYGFNHDEAERSFRRAAELDPQMAMAHWGIALAVGPNYNSTTVNPERRKAAYEAIRRALSLASQAPAHERAYIEAMAQRFSADPAADQRRLALAYRDAMRALAARYPDDLEAATLYADSAMILNAWGLWRLDGQAAAGTDEIIAVLESVLRRNPDHIGANHLYIHAVEASPQPERALAAADRLGRLAPGAGHLVHMPAHIYMRVGDYEAAARSNDLAARADRAYIEATGAQGIYPSGYYSHNLHFLAAAYSMQGRFEDAMRAAAQLETNVGERLRGERRADRFMTTSTLLLVRFRRWDAILKSAEPASSMAITSALWHWARALAYAATGKPESAAAEQKIFTAAAGALAPDARYGINRASDVLRIAAHLLDARLASARGDGAGAVEFLRKAVAAEDELAYDEPPDWYYPPARESLGGTLLLQKEYAEAEKVFRADLSKNRRNGRSLFGLAESLRAQGRTYEAALVRREFESAWKNADTRLSVEDL